MKNVTITLDEDTARWVRIEAAKSGESVSRLVGDLLRERRLRETEYQAAAERYLSRQPAPIKAAAEGYPLREDLHDR